MRWEKIADNPAESLAPVVRALSFSKRTEDGCVVVGENRSSPLRSQTSFTSFDVKKSRRNARTPVRTTTNSMQRSEPAARPSQPLSTQSLHRPSKINKLVLRVPSDASEYRHCRVIHSTCVVPQAEGDGAQRLSSPPCISPSVSVVSQACQTNVPFSYHLKEFPSEESISAGLGSCSLSNLSSVDGVSTQSRVSTTFGDGFSTPTRMGSTTRLVQTKKTPFSARCSRCWRNEQFTTALCVLSFAGSLGNLLRLPRMVFFHGGGVFLIVYVLMAFVFGLPLMFLEIGLGQFCQHGTIKLWRAVNLFRGVGYAKTLLAYLLAISYSVQIVSALSMLVYVAQESVFMERENATGIVKGDDIRYLVSENNTFAWLMRILFLSIVWFLVVICLIKRSVTYRRVLYFLFPVSAGLTIALFSNVAAVDVTRGLNKLLTFNWIALGDTQVWYFATVQMFFSLQLGFGSIGTCAGKIFPKTNALWVAGCIVSGSVVMGLAWVVLVYTWLSSLPDPFSISTVPEDFLFTLINQMSSNVVTVWISTSLIVIVGLSSLFALVYSIVIATAIETKKRLRWRHMNLIISAVACLIASLSFIPGVLSMTHVIEHYAVGHGVLALTILELVGFAMIYGCGNVYNDLEFVIGSKLGLVWKSLWLVTPCVLFTIELCSAFLLPLNCEAGQKVDSTWEMTFGWILYLVCWIIVILCAGYQIWVQVDYNIAQKFLSSMKPSRNWGPVDPIYRHCWVQWRNRYLMTGSRDFTLKRRGTRDYTHRARNSNLTKTDSSSYQWPHSVQSIY